MTRQTDKVILALAGLALVTLISLQSCAVFAGKAEVAAGVAEARRLVETAAKTEPPDMVRDTNSYAGRVFAAWAHLPLAQPLTTPNFYPPPSPARPRN